MTGSLAVENIFSIPGIGSLFVDCIKANDYPVIMGITIFYAAFYMLIVLLVDLAYSLIDPRIRLAKGKGELIVDKIKKLTAACIRKRK